MLVELTLSVKSKDFYQFLLDSLVSEIVTYEPSFTKDKLCAGYSYSKNMKGKIGQKSDTVVKVERLIANSIYEASVTSAKGIFEISYNLVDKGDETNVIYEESYIGNGTLNQLNYKIVSNFYKKKSRKKIIANLRGAELYLNSKEEK